MSSGFEILNIDRYGALAWNNLYPVLKGGFHGRARSSRFDAMGRRAGAYGRAVVSIQTT